MLLHHRVPALLGLALAISLLTAGVALAGVSVTQVDGNPRCPAGAAYKIDNVNESGLAGTYSGPGGTSFTISNVDAARHTFDWSASKNGQPLTVTRVIVKGGPTANLYDYNPAASSDTGLHAPNNPNGAGPKYYGLSHIDFCGFDASGGTTPSSTNPSNPGGNTNPAQTTTRASTARLGLRRACVAGRLAVTVRGRGMRRVVFSVNGRRARTVNVASGRLTASAVLRVGKGAQRVTARVLFRSGYAPLVRTLRGTAVRCSSKAAKPKFTG